MKILLTVILFLTSSYSFAEYRSPKTIFGHPDLQGIWTNSTITPLERPSHIGSASLSKEDAEKWERKANGWTELDQKPIDPNEPAPPPGRNNKGYESFWVDPGKTLAVVNGEIRSSIISYPKSGKIPYKAATQGKLSGFLHNIQYGLDGPEQRPPGERCLVGYGSSGGPPMLPVLYNNHIQIVQNKDHVLIHVEMNHDARIVRLNSDHIPMRSWLGDSIGVWKNNTLVVTTKNFVSGQDCRASLKNWFCISQNAVIVERFTRIKENEILYEFEVNDPESFTDVWRGELPLRAAKGPIYEYACHEGNYGMANILSGARQQEEKSNEYYK